MKSDTRREIKSILVLVTSGVNMKIHQKQKKNVMGILECHGDESKCPIKESKLP